MNTSWESSVILAATKTNFEVLPSVGMFATQEHYIDVTKIELEEELNVYLKKDTHPLPVTEDREGYYDDRHYDYWLSGLIEFLRIRSISEKYIGKIGKETKVLDFGCASGRVLRHFALQSTTVSWGCDINENHVLWCNKYLPNNSIVFQNTSLPHLQIADNFLDLIYCLSVFTHIESFETSWLCELNRILKPGGIAYITIHDENSWQIMPKDWGVGYAVINHPEFNEEWLTAGFPNEKFISRWQNNKSYTSNVFYRLSYIEHVWSKFFSIKEIIPNGSNYQTVLILQKN
ncbi:class I SAM-dependent methyltransferase [Lacibacter sediminis]|uniref:Class I SAM-dependent methyltransferase n=1 Tax=Lacibacter sediminis TaxID=2760713 RepID=A0A7G5XED8_9BACT|nr:class I SAM-dependent methyltransferase [Lacibacter sediminis]QNA43841.1 class I SAM-dependent methyltransferase [Lacibacter sediminis]